MNANGVRIGWVTWFGLLLTLGLLSVSLLVINHWQSREKPLPVYGTVADFSLVNQDGQPVSLGTLKGHPWVGDIIFTRCAGPCLRMSRQMKALQEALPAESKARLVSLTTDPEYDTPVILKRYGARFDEDSKRWMFLTGTADQIGRLATQSLKLSALPKKPGERLSPADLFIHSTIFVVVDKHARLRGIFETGGEGTDPAQVRPKILAALTQLEHES